MKTLILIVIAALISGCATKSSLVKKQFSPTRAGVAKVLNQGAGFVIDSRKRQAGAEMREFCQGPFKILSEDAASEHDGYMAAPYSAAPTALALSSEYLYIKFECVSKAENSEPHP